LREGKGIGGGGKQGRDRKPITEEQEVVVGVYPAAVCSHYLLITAARGSGPLRGHLALTGRELTRIPCRWAQVPLLPQQLLGNFP
jgi:hypothetical protein